jgi:hypothetical protein
MVLEILLETQEATAALDAALATALGYAPEAIRVRDELDHSVDAFTSRVHCLIERNPCSGDITYALTAYCDKDFPPAVQTDITFAQALTQRIDARAYAHPETAHFPDDFVRVLASGELQPVEIDQSDDGLRFTVRKG